MGETLRNNASFDKQAQTARMEPILAAAGIAPELVRESLVDHPELTRLDLNSIKNDAVKNGRFTSLIVGQYPGRAEEILLAWHDNTLTETDRDALAGLVEDFKMRSALGEAAEKHLDKDMVGYASQYSPDFASALGNMNDPVRVQTVLREAMWRKVMGDRENLDEVRNTVSNLADVSQAMNSPLRRGAEEYLSRRLKQMNINTQQFNDAIVAGDRAASIRNIVTLMETQHQGWWKIATFGFPQEAENLYGLANDPARGGLGTANEIIRRRIGTVGTMLALTTLPNPEVREALTSAPVDARFPAAGRVGARAATIERPAVLTNVSQFESLSRRVNPRSFWRAFELYAATPDNMVVAGHPAGTTFESLPEADKDAFIQNHFAPAFRARLNLFAEGTGILGVILRAMARPQVEQFLNSALTLHGVTPDVYKRTLNAPADGEPDYDAEGLPIP